MEITGTNLQSYFIFSPPDNEGWMNTDVQVKVPHFECNFKCTIELNEFKQFVNLLKELESSIGKEKEIYWSNMEENIEFTLKLKKLGSVEGSYKFSHIGFCSGPTLSGEFDADQTYISNWVTQANSVIPKNG